MKAIGHVAHLEIDGAHVDVKINFEAMTNELDRIATKKMFENPFGRPAFADNYVAFREKQLTEILDMATKHWTGLGWASEVSEKYRDFTDWITRSLKAFRTVLEPLGFEVTARAISGPWDLEAIFEFHHVWPKKITRVHREPYDEIEEIHPMHFAHKISVPLRQWREGRLGLDNDGYILRVATDLACQLVNSRVEVRDKFIEKMPERRRAEVYPQPHPRASVLAPGERPLTEAEIANMRKNIEHILRREEQRTEFIVPLPAGVNLVPAEERRPMSREAELKYGIERPPAVELDEAVKIFGVQCCSPKCEPALASLQVFEHRWGNGTPLYVCEKHIEEYVGLNSKVFFMNGSNVSEETLLKMIDRCVADRKAEARKSPLAGIKFELPAEDVLVKPDGMVYTAKAEPIAVIMNLEDEGDDHPANEDGNAAQRG